MFARSSAIVALTSLVLAAPLAVPAAAGSDTTPPQLVSLSVSPDRVDTSSTSQTVTVSAVITDDLAGIASDTQIQVWSPSGIHEAYGFFTNVSGNSYSATMTVPLYAENGIWKDWYVFLYDNVGNGIELDEYELIQQGINVAVGVGDFSASYVRSVSLKLGRTRASGVVDTTQASACYWYVPVLLQRKTRSGWHRVGQALTNYQGRYSIPIHSKGKYRVTATEFGIGTPALTMCMKASKRSSSLAR